MMHWKWLVFFVLLLWSFSASFFAVFVYDLYARINNLMALMDMCVLWAPQMRVPAQFLRGCHSGSLTHFKIVDAIALLLIGYWWMVIMFLLSKGKALYTWLSFLNHDLSLPNCMNSLFLHPLISAFVDGSVYMLQSYYPDLYWKYKEIQHEILHD